MSKRLALFPRREQSQSPPARTFGEMLRHLGDGHFEAGRFRLARRSYRAACKVEPDNAGFAVRLGRAWEDDPDGGDERAFRCFRRAVKLDSSDGLHHALLGRSAVRLRRDDVARAALAEAMKLAPADAAVLAVAVEAYREAGRLKKAWKLVCRARFLAPNDRAVRDLWNRVRFDMTVRTPTVTDDTGERTILPFLRIVTDHGQSTWRLDAPAVPRLHAEI